MADLVFGAPGRTVQLIAEEVPKPEAGPVITLYRLTEETTVMAAELNQEIVMNMPAPVCIPAILFVSKQ